MKLIPIAANQTELQYEDTIHSGLTVFFSYQTPVAAWIPGRGAVRTDKKWSVTTSRHINNWLRRVTGEGNYPAQTETQEFFDNLVA